MSRTLKALYPEKYQEYKENNYNNQNINQAIGKKEKELCKALADNICAICGKAGKDAHHIVPVSVGGEHSQDNLICLCRSCHERVHKNVYIIDPITKAISINFQLNALTETDKQEYVAEFEKITGNKIFKSTGGYYYFVGLEKIKITAAEIKEIVNYKSATDLREMFPEKKKSIAERKQLEQWKKYFKESHNKPMWHQMCKLIRIWDQVDVQKKQQVFKKLNDNWPEIAKEIFNETL